METRAFEPGQVIATYAGYLNRGLSEEDAVTAMKRFAIEHPGQEYCTVEFEPGRFRAFAIARERVEVVVDGDIVTDEDFSDSPANPLDATV